MSQNGNDAQVSSRAPAVMKEAPRLLRTTKIDAQAESMSTVKTANRAISASNGNIFNTVASANGETSTHTHCRMSRYIPNSYCAGSSSALTIKVPSASKSKIDE